MRMGGESCQPAITLQTMEHVTVWSVTWHPPQIITSCTQFFSCTKGPYSSLILRAYNPSKMCCLLSLRFLTLPFSFISSNSSTKQPFLPNSESRFSKNATHSSAFADLTVSLQLSSGSSLPLNMEVSAIISGILKGRQP